jgi:hypothetical protein
MLHAATLILPPVTHHPQASTIMSAATLEQATAHAASRQAEDSPRPHLVVCPSTLVPHWGHEIAKFVEPHVLHPLLIQGPPQQRAALQQQLARQQAQQGSTQGRQAQPQYNVVVMSYEHLRADAEWVAAQRWCYCVLDEGHMIQNPRSKVAAAARRVAAQHRLLLSGTPVQNSVLELWSLFDFLMPGFLGGWLGLGCWAGCPCRCGALMVLCCVGCVGCVGCGALLVRLCGTTCWYAGRSSKMLCARVAQGSLLLAAPSPSLCTRCAACIRLLASQPSAQAAW